MDVSQSIGAPSRESKRKGRHPSVSQETLLAALAKAGATGATIQVLATTLNCSRAVVRHNLDQLLYSQPDKVGRSRDWQRWRYFYEPTFKTQLKHYGNAQPDEGRMIALLMHQYRQGAHARNLNFNLTTEEFKALVTTECYYCGALPTERVLRREAHYSYSLICNGVDRPDVSRGYEPDNCVSACTICNKIKMALTPAEFRDWLQRAYQHFVEAA